MSLEQTLELYPELDTSTYRNLPERKEKRNSIVQKILKPTLPFIFAGTLTALSVLPGCRPSQPPVTPPSIIQPSPTPTQPAPSQTPTPTPHVSQPTPQPPTTQPTPSPIPVIINPVEEYAKSIGLSDAIISRLKSLGEDRAMDKNEKESIKYLYDVSKAEVVSPKILKLTPSNYKDEVVRSLQTKVIDYILKEGVSPDEGKALTYLSTFPGQIQRNLIESGFDDTLVNYLVLNSSLEDQGFARYAVENTLCIKDNSLTDLETKFLKNHSQENLEKLLKSYESDLYSYPDIGPVLLKGIQNIPEYKIDLDILEAMENITYMLKVATNPEVKEAFKLMIKGGTPDQNDFGYKVPNWNTELEILYELASKNRLKENDTLALAIAMVNGVYITMGDDNVVKAVYRDTDELLNFFRDTNEIQKARGYYPLEEYLLEHILPLVWTGNQTPVFSQDHALFLFNSKKLDLGSYKWNNVSVDTLRQMQEYMDKRWIDKNVDNTVTNIENYLYFSSHWNYLQPKDESASKVLVDGKEVRGWFFGNVDFQFEYFLKNGKGFGVCTDEEALADAYCKSWGIATNAIQMLKRGSTHTAITYYEPITKMWKIHKGQITNFSKIDPQINRDLYIFRQPIMQKGYIGDSNIVRDYLSKGWVYLDNGAYFRIKQNISAEETKSFLSAGIETQQMKAWLLQN